MHGYECSCVCFARCDGILLTKEQIAERVKVIGEQISEEYKGQSIVLIGVLKGAAIFLADLARSIKVDNTFDFVAVSSYGRARVSSGAVKLIKDIDNPIEGRHVILVGIFSTPG